MFSFPGLPQLDTKLVLWSLKAVQVATALLSLFGKEVVKEIAHRVQAVLEFTASDGAKGSGGRGGLPTLLTHRAYRDAPEPVRRYLQYALREGQPQLKCVCLKQSGYFRFLPGAGAGGSAAAGGEQGGAKAWKRLTGEAWVSVTRPGLVWSATIQLSPFTWVRGFAGYLRGRGSTHWKLCSLFRVDDIEGERSLDTVALLRFLAEAPCYPTALLPSDYLRWDPVDHSTARATITDAGLRASAVFRFNALGQIVGMRTTDSARSVSGGQLSRDPMCFYYRNYQRMGGAHRLRIPTEVEAAWELPSGEYSYAQLEIQDLVCWDTMEMAPHQD
ncbi:hypothetical protein N2152v2_007452 [Parachlorella kessleri]